MKRLRIAAILLAACGAAAAATPPKHPPNFAAEAASRKMGNVYLLAHAGAILEVCRASPEAEAFPEEKSREIAELSGRLAELVRTIGQHYRDGEVPSVYEATKTRMAADTGLKFHVKNNHQYCGERTLAEMRAYVSENEETFRRFFAHRKAPAEPVRK